MIEERGINENGMLVKVGIDGRHGFLKFCVPVYDFNSSDDDKEYGQREGQAFKDSGVKKIILIKMIPDIQENYINVKRLWLECGINKSTRPYTIATDLKLCNIGISLQNYCCHP